MKNNLMKRVSYIFMFMTLMGTAVFAGGLGDISTPLKTLETSLLSIAVVVVTLAFMYVGFMMVFRGAEWTDVARIFVGAMLIAGASALATLLF